MKSMKVFASIALLALVACAPTASIIDTDDLEDGTMIEETEETEGVEKKMEDEDNAMDDDYEDHMMEEEVEEEGENAMMEDKESPSAPNAVSEDQEEAKVEPSDEDAYSKAIEATGGSALTFDGSNADITFVGGSSIVDHPGAFTEFSVTLTPGTDPRDFTKTKFEAVIDITSVKTDSEKLDSHLQKPEFFDAATYPTATFTSTSIESTGANLYSIIGTLTLKGISKSVSMNASITESTITIKYDLPRKTFKIGNDSYGEKILDTIVPLTIELKL